jgi:hypothetical protein
MCSTLTIGAVIAAIIYFGLHLLIHITQDSREPCITQRNIPFLDGIIGILKHRATYLSNLGYATQTQSKKNTYAHRTRFNLPIQTLRMPFQRLYVVHAPHLIHTEQSQRSNLRTQSPRFRYAIQRAKQGVPSHAPQSFRKSRQRLHHECAQVPLIRRLPENRHASRH